MTTKNKQSLSEAMAELKRHIDYLIATILGEFRVLLTIRLFYKAWYFEPRDIWIGIYWDDHKVDDGVLIDVYICLIPLFPINLMFKIKSEADDDE